MHPVARPVSPDLRERLRALGYEDTEPLALPPPPTRSGADPEAKHRERGLPAGTDPSPPRAPRPAG